MKTLTIFTPVYNGEKVIGKLYQSLVNQDCKEFKWLIIDDGSTDKTGEIVAGFDNELVEYEYIRQENAGKYKAMLYAFEICNTELVCCVDDDLEMAHDTVAIIINEWMNRKHDVIGIGMPMECRNYNSDVIIGGKMNAAVPQIGKISELTSKYNYKGEMLYVFKSEIVKSISVPDFGKERFLKESALYFALNKYNVLWIDKCAATSVYQMGGISNNWLKLEIKSPKATLYSYKMGAIHHPLFAHRVANACLYKTWKNVMKVTDVDNTPISFVVRIFAFFINPIYGKKYGNQIKAKKEMLG